MAWEHIASHIIIDRPEFLWLMDEYREGEKQMMFMHLRVHKWSKGLFAEMKKLFATFREVVTCPLYAIGEVDDAKWEKFISYFGFKFLQDTVCENGEKRRLFLNLKEQK